MACLGKIIFYQLLIAGRQNDVGKISQPKIDGVC
jgi:hypothetical protein